MKRDLIILAGGKGTRLRPVVSEVPKPMAPIQGKPFLEWQLDWWSKWNIVDLAIICVNYKADIIRKHFGYKYKGIEIFFQEDDPSHHANQTQIVQSAAKFCEAPYFLCNGDTMVNVNPYKLFQKTLIMERSQLIFVKNKEGDWISSGLGCYLHPPADTGVLHWDMKWIDIGTPDEYKRASEKDFMAKHFFNAASADH